MILFEVLSIILLHWFADFVLQEHNDAINKHNSIKHLLNHTISYSIVMWLGILVVTSRVSSIPLDGDWVSGTFLFWIITFLTHTTTDYFTSKWSHKLFAKEDYHNFFVIIGFDQVLHYIQLFLTYKLLFL